MNLIQKAKDQITFLVEQAAQSAVADGKLPSANGISSIVEIPKDINYGDYSTNFAMAAARVMRMAPRKIADILCSYLDLEGSYFSAVSVAGAGFMNFTLGSKWYSDVLSAIESEGKNYPRSNTHHEKVMVEFVSANPTGPMHMGNARGGVLGDCLAEVLSMTGDEVSREFYVNDAGNQVEKFAKSLEARYLQIILGEDAVEFPEDGYHGSDIKDLAKEFYDIHGDSYKDVEESKRHADLASFGLAHNIPKMKSDLERYQIFYDKWFLESSLHETGYVAETVGKLTDGGWTYEKDGALWLRTSALLREFYREEGKTDAEIDKLGLKDDVLRRANGFYTYLASDIAYHRNKFEVRGFDRVINIWGADHHGHVARLKCALNALGLDGTHRLEIVLMQLVQLLRDGQPVRMSKRTGNAIALSDLLDEVSIDAARFFFNSRSAGSAIDFDLDLAVRSDSENPVYYVQYAHARICSLIRMLSTDGVELSPAANLDLTCLTAPEEIALIKALAQMPDEILSAATTRDPSRINKYLIHVAASFHKFYNAVRIKGAGEPVQSARLKLAASTRDVLAAGLGIIRVDAPEKM